MYKSKFITRLLFGLCLFGIVLFNLYSLKAIPPGEGWRVTCIYNSQGELTATICESGGYNGCFCTDGR
jgi:hypothetical protein